MNLTVCILTLWVGVCFCNADTTEDTTKKTSYWKKIPFDLLVKLGREASLSNFFKKFVKNSSADKNDETRDETLTELQTRAIAEASIGLTEAQTLVNSNQALDMERLKSDFFGPSLPVCSPEMTTVPVPLDKLDIDPSMLAVPSCLKVERCGGCCLSDIMGCEADIKDFVNYTITILGYAGENNGVDPQLEVIGNRTVAMERHKSCKCGCKIKDEHCTSPHHVYDLNQCTCICENQADYLQCLEKNPHIWFWDNDSCQCSCHEIKACSSGHVFDVETCECQPIREKRQTPLLGPKL